MIRQENSTIGCIEARAESGCTIKQTRRQFFKKTAVAVGFVGMSVLGLNMMRESESTSQTTIQTELATDFASLDAAYASLGRNKIESFLASKNLSIVNRTRVWIQSRGHAQMYDLICDGLVDPRLRVSLLSLNLVKKIDPVDLKIHKAHLGNLVTQTSDDDVRAEISKLIAVIESS